MAVLTPVAGVNIDVPTPETFGAVIRVAVPFNERAAIAAGEIFDVSLEPSGHRNSPFSEGFEAALQGEIRGKRIR